MTLSNNAIKFLQAQYRAIFKRAYIKGLATAVLLTAGLAAGQAQAVELSTGANAESDIITQGSGDTFNVSSETTVNSITIQTGHSLTTSGGINVTGDVTANGDLTIESGAILLANKETVGENENQTIYRHDFTSTGSDLNLSGNIGAASFSVSDGTLVLTAGGEGNTNLTAYGSGWNQDQASGNATDYDRGTANGEVLGMTVTVNAGTNVAALNLLTVDDKSKITLAGSGSSSGVTADNTAYLEGSRQIAISDTEITVNGYANGIFSQNGSISDSSIKISEKAKLLIAGNAEANRGPFDLAEAESELTAGYHTEYSGMGFGFYYLAEYLNLFVISGIAATVFLGGWAPLNIGVDGFDMVMNYIPGIVWFLGKTFLIVWLLMWIRWTYPRLRIDQILKLEWKYLMPLALLNIVIMTVVVAFGWHF